MEDMEKEEEEILLSQLKRIQESSSGDLLRKERNMMILVWLALTVIAVIFWIGIIKLFS